jgi:hypothetical protein
VNNGQSVNNHVAISGGNDTTNFYLGIGSNVQDGIVRASDYERTSVTSPQNLK